MNAAQMYRWKRSLDQGLKESGELVPKSLVGGMKKRVEELERALGRKALEGDNGPEYTSHRFRPFVRAMGLIPCHTPRRSPASNGLAEAFFGNFKRDDVYQACLETLEEWSANSLCGSSTTISRPRTAR